MFVKIEIWNFQHLFDSLIHETLQNFSSFGQLLFPIEKSCLNVCLNVCLNDLKFCKGSLNPHSNICWKFQLSILTNKKGLFLKKSSVPWIVLSSAKQIVSQLSYYIWLWVDGQKVLVNYAALGYLLAYIKVQLFWKGHKNLNKSPFCFDKSADLLSKHQTRGILFKFCGLLTMT